MGLKIGILGATSYTGVELSRLLAFHPHVEIAFISSQTYAGKRLAEVFPEMKNIFDAVLLSPEDASQASAQCVFSCLPHAVSAQHLVPFIDKGIKIIDLSADFRLSDAGVYEKWYDTKHPRPELLSKAVYALSEIKRNEIQKASIIANPGCYPTSILLPLLPLLKNGAEVEGIVADSKSGVSGAGRTLKLTSHFVEANENLSPYSIGRKHRHIAEIDQELSIAAKKPVEITFCPHLVPISRGMLSTIYFRSNKNAQECAKIAEEFYANDPFVRVRTSSDLPTIRGVAYTNFCDIAFTQGANGLIIAVSAIDNLVKGASGQALQNMNISFGFEEQTGLLR